MDFKTIRDECVGKSTLIANSGSEKEFIGFRGDFLVTFEFEYTEWRESEIKNWTIKKPEEKFYQFMCSLGGLPAIHDDLYPSVERFKADHPTAINIKMKQINLDEWEDAK